jgi:DNA/RNA-binding domain of Phe-tRNA-synthetase-like protein
VIALAASPEAAAIVRPAAIAVENLGTRHAHPGLDAAIARTEDALRTAAEIDRVATEVRAMYRRFGVDPTKTRPSSEALLRRIRKGEPIPRITPLVDVGNWCSVETRMPYGLYDLARIRGPIELRLGREGEAYPGIRKDVVHVAGRLTLADADGPFGNPTADSARTMVSGETREALVVVFAPASLPATFAANALALTERRIVEYVGGVVTARRQ